jgi:hypothetical protein
MDRTALVEIDKEGGKRLLKALDEAELDICSAFWFYFPEPDEWRLVLATPIVRKEGPLRAYTLIQSVLQKLDPAPDILFRHITVMSPDSALIELLREIVKTGPNSIEDILLSERVINGLHIDDTYLYRMC